MRKLINTVEFFLILIIAVPLAYVMYATVKSYLGDFQIEYKIFYFLFPILILIIWWKAGH